MNLVEAMTALALSSVLVAGQFSSYRQLRIHWQHIQLRQAEHALLLKLPAVACRGLRSFHISLETHSKEYRFHCEPISPDAKVTSCHSDVNLLGVRDHAILCP